MAMETARHPPAARLNARAFACSALQTVWRAGLCSLDSQVTYPLRPTPPLRDGTLRVASLSERFEAFLHAMTKGRVTTVRSSFRLGTLIHPVLVPAQGRVETANGPEEQPLPDE